MRIFHKALTHYQLQFSHEQIRTTVDRCVFSSVKQGTNIKALAHHSGAKKGTMLTRTCKVAKTHGANFMCHLQSYIVSRNSIPMQELNT